MRFLGTSLCFPDPFDKRRDEEAVTRRMAGTRHQVNDLLQEGWEVYTVDEVRARHEAETRRTWPPREEGKTVRGPREGEPVVLRGTGPDDQEDEDLPHRGKPERRADPPS